MSDTTTPYVSDEQITPQPKWGKNTWSGKMEMLLPPKMTAERVRDIYEARLSEVIRERDEAMERAEDIRKSSEQLLYASRRVAEKLLHPHASVNGIDAIDLKAACDLMERTITPNTPPSNG